MGYVLVICLVASISIFKLFTSEFWKDLLDALNQLEEGLKDKIRKLSSFDKYKQEVLLGHLDWNPMHKEANFWRENVTCFEENDFQVFVFFVPLSSTTTKCRAKSLQQTNHLFC